MPELQDESGNRIERPRKRERKRWHQPEGQGWALAEEPAPLIRVCAGPCHKPLTRPAGVGAQVCLPCLRILQAEHLAKSGGK